MALSGPVRRTLAPMLRRLRVARWKRRARRHVALLGCELQLSVDESVAWHSLPTFEATRQAPQDGADRGARGTLRVTVGAWAHLGRDLTIEFVPWAESSLSIGEGVTVGTGVRLILFGGHIDVGDWTRLRDGTMLKSAGELAIGEHGIVQNQTLVHCAEKVVIAERVTLAERVSVLDSDHQPDGSDTWIHEQPVSIAPVTIERNAWVGANAVVLRGVHLGRNAVVAAGSVVRAGDYPAGWLVAGVPAEPKRPLKED